MNVDFDLIHNTYQGQDLVGSGAVLDAIAILLENGQFDAAFALAAHGSDVHAGEDGFDLENKTWTQIFLEIYRRAFFDVEMSKRYGTEFIASSTIRRREMATVLMDALGSAAQGEETHATAPHFFPEVKTRQ